MLIVILEDLYLTPYTKIKLCELARWFSVCKLLLHKGDGHGSVPRTHMVEERNREILKVVP